MDDRERMRIKSFVHAARNDLNVISMGFQSIGECMDQPEKIEEILEIIRSAGIEPLRHRLDTINRTVGKETDSLISRTQTKKE